MRDGKMARGATLPAGGSPIQAHDDGYRSATETPTAPAGLDVVLVYDCIFPGSVGGIERRNAELARALAHRGHRMTVAGWCRNEQGSEGSEGIRVLPLGPPAQLYDRSGRRRLAASALFALHCLRLDVRLYDVVETAQVPYLHLLPLAVKCKLAGRPLVVSWYEFWGPYWKSYVGGVTWRLFALFEKFAARLGALTLASSRLTLERLAEHRLRNPPRLLPCGIDLARIDAVIERTRQAVDHREGPPLLYAGRLLQEKRLDLLVAALAHPVLEGITQGPVLRIVGDGPDRRRLEALARELGVERKVEFTGRLKSGDDVFTAMPEARVAVQPSAREGFGLFPLEAMAAGLPVVYCSARESAVGELVRHGREGLAVEPTAPALAVALGRLLKSDEDRSRMSQAARSRAEKYSWDAIARRAEALLRETLRNGD